MGVRVTRPDDPASFVALTDDEKSLGWRVIIRESMGLVVGTVPANVRTAVDAATADEKAAVAGYYTWCLQEA